MHEHGGSNGIKTIPAKNFVTHGTVSFGHTRGEIWDILEKGRNTIIPGWDNSKDFALTVEDSPQATC